MQAEIANTLLPTELWIQIIRELPSHYQRSCLSVSKQLHDISLQYVFASINVRLGILRDYYLADEDRWCPWNDEEKAEANTAIRRSRELLRHIVRSPSGLGKAVKHVSVRAYAFYGESPPAELMHALEEALSILRLRGFAWYGCHPMPQRRVFEALSTASGETLEDIVLPAELLDHTPIQGFSRLKSLSFLNRYADRYQLLGEEDPRFDPMRHMITTTAASLRSLGIFGEALWKCNVQRFSTLVELTLALMTDIDPIQAVFTHCSRLRSLTLFVGVGYFGDLAAILHVHSDALPLLTAFRLSYPGITIHEAEAAATFLQKKLLLERLELGHHWSTCPFDDARPVLEILPELPRLRVLGSELSGSSRIDPRLTADHLLHLSQYIPPRLTALSLWVATRAPSTVTETDWIQFFRSLRTCRFLHIATDPDYPGIGELQRTLFNHPPPLVELVGFNEDLRWVEREPETGRVAYSESWPLSKVYYRTAEEFGCEEWEWLLKNVDLRLM